MKTMTNGFAKTVDDQVLARARAGDMQAHAELYRMFGGPVYTLARRITGRPEIAEELLQETFLDVMRSIGGFRNDAPFGFWLRRMTVNRCLMFLRSDRERRNVPLEEDMAGSIGGLDSALSRVDLATLLDRLSPVGRTVLWLHDVEGYTHREIADMLDRTPSFSKSQLVRSQARLRAMVAEQAFNEEVESCTRTTAS